MRPEPRNHATNDLTSHKGGPGISRWMTFLMAMSCGLIAANLYYAQPLVKPISERKNTTSFGSMMTCS